MTREMQHESEKSGSDSRPGFSSSKAMDESAVRRLELARVSDTFRRLESAKPRQVSAEQWRKFSEDVFKQIEEQPGTFGARLRVWRDKITATDSRLLRAMALLAIVGVALVAVALVWLAVSFAVPRPAPQTVMGAVSQLAEILSA